MLLAVEIQTTVELKHVVVFIVVFY